MNRIREGSLVVAHFDGAPVLVHWTVPLAALWFCGLHPVGWVAFLALLALHHLGHTLAVRVSHARPLEHRVHGLGGTTTWRGHVGPGWRALIAWSGILAQGAALVVALALCLWRGMPGEGPLDDVLTVFTRTSLWLMAWNLVPFSWFDGEGAWKILPIARSRWRELTHRIRAQRARRRALGLD
jgi:hypothetical protein